jgi:hypothetical protein
MIISINWVIKMITPTNAFETDRLTDRGDNVRMLKQIGDGRDVDCPSSDRRSFFFVDVNAALSDCNE